MNCVVHPFYLHRPVIDLSYYVWIFGYRCNFISVFLTVLSLNLKVRIVTLADDFGLLSQTYIVVLSVIVMSLVESILGFLHRIMK